MIVTDRGRKDFPGLAERVRRDWKGKDGRLVVVPVYVRAAGDAFGIRQQMAAKMLLNAHSTAVMAKLGKVVGNTMTNVSPSNLKLIGRATFLIQSHVNDVLGTAEWVKENGRREPVSYGEANAVLYDAIATLKDKPAAAGQTAEVAFSIIRILESLRLGRGLDPEQALALVRSPGLSDYLSASDKTKRGPGLHTTGFLSGSVKTWSLFGLSGKQPKDNILDGPGQGFIMIQLPLHTATDVGDPGFADAEIFADRLERMVGRRMTDMDRDVSDETAFRP